MYKKVTFKDGFYNLSIYAFDKAGNFAVNYVSFLIDSKNPKILKINPKRGYTNGEFSIEFKEDNPKSVIMDYGNLEDMRTKEIQLDNCSRNYKGNYECKVKIDLNDFNGREINSRFLVTDIKGKTDESKLIRLKVDITPPELNIYSPEENVYRKRVLFNLTSSENVKIEYKDNSGLSKWRILCSNCDKYGFNKKRTKYFKKGVHNLDIMAIDKAGNKNIKNISFEVVY